MAEREDKDVPSWDANVETWEKYRLQVHYYLKQVPYWKQPYQIAKLVRNLRGKCWALIEKLPEKSRAQLEKNEEVFLGFLKKHLLQGEIPELGRIFKLYLGLKRQKGESMMMYVIRHRELLNKLGKSMRSVQGNDLEKHLKKKLKDIGYVEPREEWEWEHPEEERNQEQQVPQFRTWGTRRNAPQDEAPPDNTSVHSQRSRWSAREWREWEEWQYGTKKDEEEQELDLPKLAREELLLNFVRVAEKLPDGGLDKDLLKLVEIVSDHWKDDVLPTMLSGWHLLEKSGLSPAERSTVIASSSMLNIEIKHGSSSSSDRDAARLHSLELDRIETALRTQWQDEELMARDERASAKERKHGKHRRHESGYQAEEISDDSSSNSGEEAHVTLRHETESTNSSEDIIEGEALLAEISEESEQENLQTALRAMWESKDKKKVARRTFVQARAVMKDIKRKRSFFRPRKETAHAFIPSRSKSTVPKPAQTKASFRSSSSGPNHKNSGKIASSASNSTKLCYRCGGKDHIAKDCTQPRPLSANLAEEVAGMAESSDSESSELRRERQVLEGRLRELNRKAELKRKLQQIEAEGEKVRRELSDLEKGKKKMRSSSPKLKARQQDSPQRGRRRDRSHHRHKSKKEDKHRRRRCRSESCRRPERRSPRSVTPERNPRESSEPTKKPKEKESQAPAREAPLPAKAQSLYQQDEDEDEYEEEEEEGGQDIDNEVDPDSFKDKRTATAVREVTLEKPIFDSRPKAPIPQNRPAQQLKVELIPAYNPNSEQSKGAGKSSSSTQEYPTYQDKGKGKGKNKGKEKGKLKGKGKGKDSVYAELRRSGAIPAKATTIHERALARHQDLPARINTRLNFSPSPEADRIIKTWDGSSRTMTKHNRVPGEAAPARQKYRINNPARDRLSIKYLPVWPCRDVRTEELVLKDASDPSQFISELHANMRRIRARHNGSHPDGQQVVLTNSAGMELPTNVMDNDVDLRLENSTDAEDFVTQPIVETPAEVPAPTADLTNVKEPSDDEDNESDVKVVKNQQPATPVADPTPEVQTSDMQDTANVKSEEPKVQDPRENIKLIEPKQEDALMVSEEICEEAFSTNSEGRILIDSGATGNLIHCRWAEMFVPGNSVIAVHSDRNRGYRFANNATGVCSSEVELDTVLGRLRFDVLEDDDKTGANPPPALLGIRTLREIKASLHLAEDILETTQGQIKLCRGQNGHVYLRAEDFFRCGTAYSTAVTTAENLHTAATAADDAE